MTLTVVGREGLDELQEWASSLFSAVPNLGIAPPDFSKLPRPYDDASVPQAYLIQPVMQLERLTLTWFLPGLQQKLAAKPLYLASYLLGGEYDGSLTLELISAGLAEGHVTCMHAQVRSRDRSLWS